MKRVACIFLIAVVMTSMFVSTEAGCWNYVTGSRCDNEDFWAHFGYKRCNDKCKNLGYDSGTCSKNSENCFGWSRNVNVCKCN